MATPRQPDLFGEQPPSPTAKDLRIVRQAGTPLRPEQQKFNKLLAEVRRWERKLAEWVEFREGHLARTRHEAPGPVDRLVNARRRLILVCAEVLEGKHGGAAPKKAERRRLIAALIEFCLEHLLDGHSHDTEIMAIHDQYASFSIQEALEQDGVEGSIDFSESPGAGKRSGKRKKSSFTAPAEPDNVDHQQPLRDVYRKLASALHPDRASDEADRVRRTELMQQVNQAYSDKNLLTLFELQLQIEQIDEDHMYSMPSERLVRFNALLAERLESLKRGVAEITDAFRSAMLQTPTSMTPAAVAKDFENWLAGVVEETARLEAWSSAMPEASWRKHWLNDREIGIRAQEQELNQLSHLLPEIESILAANLNKRRPAR